MVRASAGGLGLKFIRGCIVVGFTPVTGIAQQGCVGKITDLKVCAASIVITTVKPADLAGKLRSGTGEKFRWQ